MNQDIKLTDILIEVLDARAPLATSNPDIKKMCGQKKRILLLNKADLAEEAVSSEWMRFFQSEGYSCMAMDARNRNCLNRLLSLIGESAKEKKDRDKKRGINPRPVRVMIAGIPNSGKSTLINTISGRTAAKTGNKPGVTKGDQWIRMNPSVELMDTPGILWPKIEDEETGMILAWLGSVNDLPFDLTELSLELIRFLRKRYSGLLDQRYAADHLNEMDTLKKIAAERGCLLKGGDPDYEKAAGILLNEFRSGKTGRISLQTPPAFLPKQTTEERNA